jgi:large subunit ribosomal protein L6
MLIHLTKKNKIKVPKNVTILLDRAKNYIIIKGPFGTRFVKQEFLIIFIKQKTTIYITDLFYSKKFKNSRVTQKKKQKYMLFLKKKILEVSLLLTKKLKFIGLSYKFILINKEFQIFKLNLGYSHNIFFKPSNNINIFFVKNTTMYLKSFNYNLLSEIVARIRSYKKPEPYKGKGILYENEKIIKKKPKKL